MYYVKTSPVVGPDGDVILGRPLHDFEFDANNKNASTRLDALEAIQLGLGFDPTTPFTVVGNQLYVKLSNGDTYGPYTLPASTWNFRNPPSGAWQPSTSYQVYDVFVQGATVYQVLVAHVSALTFSAGATDGGGHNLYGVLLTIPGGSLPIGGSYPQLLYKRSSADYAVGWGQFIPPAGAAGTALFKASITDFDNLWRGITFADVAGAAAPAQLRSPVATPLATSGSASIDPSLGNVFTITPTADTTISAASAPVDASIKLLVLTSGTASYNLTLDSGTIASQGVLATGTVSGKRFQVTFTGDGTLLWEASRTVAM